MPQVGLALAPEPVLPLAYLYPFFYGVGQEELLPERNVHLPLLVQQQECSELFSSFGKDKEKKIQTAEYQNKDTTKTIFNLIATAVKRKHKTMHQSSTIAINALIPTLSRPETKGQ